MNEISSPHFLPVVILCTVHLSAGFAVGLFVADSYRRKQPTRRKSSLEKSLRVYRDGFERVSQHASKLSSMTAGKGQRVPEAFIVAVRELAETTREIKQHMQRADRSGSRPNPKADAAQPAMSVGELRSLVRSSQPNEPVPERLEGERYAYSVPQWMGRCVGSRMPTPEEFERVMCCDISLDGISFYADDVQIGQSVVIAIGRDETTAFVVAEIRHRRVISFNEKLTYRVGCRFLRRLSENDDRSLVEAYRQALCGEQAAAGS